MLEIILIPTLQIVEWCQRLLDDQSSRLNDYYRADLQNIATAIQQIADMIQGQIGIDLSADHQEYLLHEIRTQFALILGYTNILMLESYPQDSHERFLIQEIHNSAKELLEIIERDFFDKDPF